MNKIQFVECDNYVENENRVEMEQATVTASDFYKWLPHTSVWINHQPAGERWK